jgi:hypothetical protein
MVRLARVFSLIPSLSIKKACVDAETFAFQVLVFSVSRRLSGVVEVAKERRIPRNKRNGFSVVLATAGGCGSRSFATPERTCRANDFGSASRTTA